MTIDPKTSAIINLILAAAGAIAGAGAVLTPVFGSGTAQMIVGAAGIVTTILGALNSGLHAVSSPMAGPLVTNPLMTSDRRSS